MARSFAIKGKAARVMADVNHAMCPLDPFNRAGRWRRDVARTRPDGGQHRVLRKGVEDVGQQQFLVLRLMVTAQLDQFAGVRRQPRPCSRHGSIDVRTIGQHIVERGARKHAPPGTGMAFPLGIVIAVEQIGVSGIERFVVVHEVAQNKRL